jgi:hypothetical protein
MQTFLPYPDFKKSLESLDNKRLGKQRVETFQILNAILGRPKKDGTPYKGWLNHPCSIMWKDYTESLKLYFNLSLSVWIDRGFTNTMQPEILTTHIVKYPHWLGFEKFHSSHRANLLRKDLNYYSDHGWVENPEDPYVWLDKDGKWYQQKISEKVRYYI